MKNLYGLGDYSTKQITEMAREVERQGLDPAPIYYRRPDAAPEPKALLKEMPKEEARYFIPDAFAGERGASLVSGLTREHFSEIGAHGDPYLREAVRLALERALATDPENAELLDRKRYINFSPAWRI